IAARDADRGTAMAGRLGCTFIRADIASSSDRGRLVDDVQRLFGRVDVLVNCAATMSGMAPFLEVSEQQYDAILDVNLRGTVFLASDASAYISGTVIPIDGGQLAT